MDFQKYAWGSSGAETDRKHLLVPDYWKCTAVRYDGWILADNSHEIISYDFGGRKRDQGHATITSSTTPKTPASTLSTAMHDRLPHGARPVSKEKAARGKLPTDTWWQTIVATNNGKPGIPPRNRCHPGTHHWASAILASWFWTFLPAAEQWPGLPELWTRFHHGDEKPPAITVMRQRFAEAAEVEFFENGEPWTN